MTSIPLVPSDAGVLFLDTQPGLLELSRTVDPLELTKASVRLARLARMFDMPVVVSTVMLEGPTQITPDIATAIGTLPHHVPGRTTTNAFTHGATADTIKGLRRKTWLVAGILTEVAVQSTALSAVERGYGAQVVIDACGGLSPRTEDAALRRLSHAGVAITSCVSLVGQFMGDFTLGPISGPEALRFLMEIVAPAAR